MTDGRMTVRSEIWLEAGEDWKPSQRAPFNEVRSREDAERFAERHEAKLVALSENSAAMVEPTSHRTMAILGWRRPEVGDVVALDPVALAQGAHGSIVGRMADRGTWVVLDDESIDCYEYQSSELHLLDGDFDEVGHAAWVVA